MASHIADTLGLIDAAVASYAQTVFTNFSGPINTVLAAAGIFGLAWIAANSVLAFAPTNFRNYFSWAVRYIIIVAVATSWTQFQPIYQILTDVPSQYGAQLLSAGNGAADLNVAMDQMVTEIFDFSDRADDEAGFLSISITSVLLLVLGALMACVAILVSAIAKIGIAMSVSLAPIMIACALFSATRSLFESWTRFTLGFAMIPLILAGIMGAILGVGEGLSTTVSGASELSQAAGFIIVILAAVFMMKNVPTLATGLAGSIVAAGAGIAESRQAMNQAGDVAKGFGSAATAPVRGAYSATARMDAGQQAAAGVEERGGGKWAQRAAYITQAARMSKDRQRFSDLSSVKGPSGTASIDRRKVALADAAASSSTTTNRPNSASSLAQRKAAMSRNT